MIVLLRVCVFFSRINIFTHLQAYITLLKTKVLINWKMCLLDARALGKRLRGQKKCKRKISIFLRGKNINFFLLHSERRLRIMYCWVLQCLLSRNSAPVFAVIVRSRYLANRASTGLVERTFFFLDFLKSVWTRKLPRNRIKTVKKIQRISLGIDYR